MVSTKRFLLLKAVITFLASDTVGELSVTATRAVRKRKVARVESSLNPRQLQKSEIFEVPLFLELQYVNASVATLLGTIDLSQPALNLCQCIEDQSIGPIAYRAAAEMNASISIHNTSECRIIDTAKVDDPEVLGIFGPAYTSLQLHVAQNISVTSQQAFDLSMVISIISSAFQISTGGQRIFLNCLNRYNDFSKVLAVEQRRGLSIPTSAPSNAPLTITPGPTNQPSMPLTTNPTNSPSVQPTLRQTQKPSIGPSALFSEAPSQIPSTSPSRRQTSFPSESPSTPPSTFPSVLPSIMPTQLPSFGPSQQVVPAPSIVPSLPPSRKDDDTFGSLEPGSPKQATDTSTSFEAWIIATLASIIATIGVTTVFVCCICYRRRYPKRSKPMHALNTKDGQLHENFRTEKNIPGFVELDQISLAETTLGDQTAGYKKPRSGRKEVQKPKHIRQTESFDENSLYTTPFSVKPDEACSYYQTHTGPSIVVSHYLHPDDLDRSMLYPISDGATSSSDGLSSFDMSSMRLSPAASYAESNSKRPENPSKNQIALSGTTNSSLDSSLNHIKNQTKAQLISKVIDQGNSAYDVDVWSCGFDDADGSIISHNKDLQSRSPSHSSRSTAKAKNLSSTRNDNKIKDAARRFQPSGPGTELSISKPANVTANTVSPENTESRAWSHWTSMISDAPPQEKEEYRVTSPLSKLLDSVTQAVSSPMRPFHNSIPAVTPEENESDIDQPTVSSWSRGDESTLIGLQFKDEASASSESTGMSASPWLFEKVEESLGPRSVTADMESLSGRSNISTKSPGNRSRLGGSVTARSAGSRTSYQSVFGQSDTSLAPRTLEHDLRRLGKQLHAMDHEVVSTSSTGISSVTGTSLTKATSPGSVYSKIPRKKIVVDVPPGKLGVILTNRHDGSGTVVSEIRESSPLYKLLNTGDKLVAIDNEDVTKMVVSQITSLMASKADQKRRLTVISSAATESRVFTV